MKAKVVLAIVALSYAPLGVAGNKAEYPNEKVAEFVIEKLDVTSLPSTFRPKREKGKKTFADYGFTVQTVDENEAIIEAAGGVRRLAIKVLEQVEQLLLAQRLQLLVGPIGQPIEHRGGENQQKPDRHIVKHRMDGRLDHRPVREGPGGKLNSSEAV